LENESNMRGFDSIYCLEKYHIPNSNRATGARGAAL